MPDPTTDELYEALTFPYVSRLPPDLAAAHLLALGADGPALRALAALSERDFVEALELLPAAAQEAAHVLDPVRASREALHEDTDVAVDCLVISWPSSSIGERIDEVAVFLDDLARAVADVQLGEVEGPVDEADEQVAFCYGEDLLALRAFVAARLPAAPVPPAGLSLRSERERGPREA